MNIGLVPALNPAFGGSHQYTLAMLTAWAGLSKSPSEGDSFTLFLRDAEKTLVESLIPDAVGRKVIYSSFQDKILSLIKRLVGQGFMREAVGKARQQLSTRKIEDPGQIRYSGYFRKWLSRYGIDWVLYTGPDARSFESDVPYVMPIFDLQHRLQPEFPEVSADGEWEHREYLYRHGTRNATLLLADSETGKQDILDCYASFGVTADKIVVLPYVPPPYLDSVVPQSERQRVRALYRLPDRFLFYPAQFWPHKNHLRVIQALAQLKRTKGIVVPLVLCGTYRGDLRTRVYGQLMTEARRLNVDSQIHYLGYVPNEVMSVLYSEATGLVMPTFFGPTNIPVVEAWMLDCPVITSDIRGIREQVGDAGVLVDPRSVDAIADGMRRVWESSDLRGDLARRGKARVSEFTVQEYGHRLADIVQEANARVRGKRSPADIRETIRGN